MSNAKIVVVGDPHFGAKQNNRALLESQEKFWYDQLIPFLNENPVDKLFILGDFFDNRTSIDVFIQNRAKLLLHQLEVDTVILLGNHDTYYKTSLDTNSLEPIVDGVENVEVITEPKLIHVGNNGISLAPWIIDPASIETIPDADILLAHLELYGFQAQPGYNATFGLDPTLFKRWPLIISGHYHTRQQTGNIMYIGAPYELTWHDVDQPKGFMYFAGGNIREDWEFIPNEHSSRHIKLRYESADQWEPPELGKDWVKLFVDGEEDPTVVRADIEKFIKANPQLLSFEVVDNFQYAYDGVGVSVEALRVKDTLVIMNEYVDDLEVPVGLDKKVITKFMSRLYNEAQEQMKS